MQRVSDSLRITTPPAPKTLGNRVRSAILWRSGTQILGQLVAWGSTFAVIRILGPSDYGLFAMTQVVLSLLNMLNGYGLASALVQRGDDTPAAIERAARQLFGMLIALNVALALMQVAAAPLAAAYFRHPEVAQLLRVQALLYLTTPFIALPYALLSRSMDFKRQAAVNVASAVGGAVAALAGALGGLGVWTLVVAPLTLFTVRAIGMMTAAGAWIRPSFDFRGAGAMGRYGATMAAGQLFWFVQSQADVFIGGRLLDAHALGLYTTSLFLTQIFVSKFVPPLNEVAFSAYARMQHDRSSVARAFLMSVRLIFLAGMPFYIGLAATAEPLVAVVLGPQWLEAAPIVALLALAMPFMTLQVLFAPASDACGAPQISARNSATGAVMLGGGFLIGAHWGVTGLTLSWLAAYPPYLAISARRTLPVIGVRAPDLIRAAAPAVGASLCMGCVVMVVDLLLPALTPVARLSVLVTAGAATYAAVLVGFARDTVREAVALVRQR